MSPWGHILSPSAALRTPTSQVPLLGYQEHLRCEGQNRAAFIHPWRFLTDWSAGEERVLAQVWWGLGLCSWLHCHQTSQVTLGAWEAGARMGWNVQELLQGNAHKDGKEERKGVGNVLWDGVQPSEGSAGPSGSHWTNTSPQEVPHLLGIGLTSYPDQHSQESHHLVVSGRGVSGATARRVTTEQTGRTSLNLVRSQKQWAHSLFYWFETKSTIIHSRNRFIFENDKFR